MYFIHSDLFLYVCLGTLIICIELLEDDLIFVPLDLIKYLGIINEFVKEEYLFL